MEGDTSGFHIVRIIRDPYERAVSIFRHALMTNFADKDAAAAGLDFNEGVSFRQFLKLVLALDMKTADTHYRPQFHPFESLRRPDTIINVSKSDLFGELNALERQKGWPITDFFSMQWFHSMESSRRPPTYSPTEERMFNAPIARADPLKKNTAFPDYDRLLTPKARSRIEQIYRVDFEAYRDHF